MAAVCETLALLIPPSFVEFWRERGRDWGPIAAGALFGGGVWIWGDAVATSATRVPFDRVRVEWWKQGGRRQNDGGGDKQRKTTRAHPLSQTKPNQTNNNRHQTTK